MYLEHFANAVHDLLGNNHLIFMGGGGQEDLSEPENFFCLFLEQENFFRRPFGPDYFFKTSQSSFH